MCNVILSLFFQTETKCLRQTEGDSGNESAPPPRAINEEEAEMHRQKLEKMIDDLRRSALEPSIREIMGDFVISIKTCCEEIYPPLTSADVQKVLHSMGDPYGLAI